MGQGIRSSRKLEKAIHEDIAFRLLSGNQQPDHWTLSEFRRRHHNALGRLFVQSVQMAKNAGLVKMGHIAVDGTKIKANASKHSAMSYGRMEEEERRLLGEIKKFFEEADAIDDEEDRMYGSRRGDELPEHLNTQAKRVRAIQKAMRELEEEARRKAAEEEAKKKEQAQSKGRKPPEGKKPDEIKPAPKAQRNFTDPESRIMKNSDKAFIQGYNGQLAVDAETQIIVGATLTNQSADCPHLIPLIEQVRENVGERPAEVSADAGYFSQSNIQTLKDLCIEAFIPPDKMKHSEWKQLTPPKGRIPKDMSLTDRMRRKLRTKHGRERYKLRMCSVEPVFGQIKECRGLRQFLLRGLEKLDSLWLLDCAVHNLLKIFRAGGRLCPVS